LNDQLSALPQASGGLSTGQKATTPTALSDMDADLQARLDNLRRE